MNSNILLQEHTATKGVLTRGGSLVRIYTQETGAHGKIHGAYLSGEDWHAVSWNKDGHFNDINDAGNQPKSAMDLITVQSVQPPSVA